jgi:reverse gyrase
VQVDFWVKILGNKTPNRALSAGRVQTPVLGWIIDRFNKYNATKQKYSIVKVGNELLYLPVVFEKEEVNVEITKIKKAAKKLKPLPPYTTDTLLEDVSRLLGISSADAMKIAQDLFEAGLITYHRTDSTRISAVGISVAETFLSNLLGNKYKQVFSPRSWAISEGAHEGIRPTKPLDAQRVIQMIQEGELILNKLSAQHLKVYNLIFKRFITSQLKPLKVKSEEIEMQLTQNDKSATASIQIYTEASFGNKEIDNLLMPYVYKPKISTFEQVNKGEIVGHIERSEYPLYTEGDVIKEMKDKKIGRPSTYSTIISTLEKRNYIKVSKKRKKLIPTKLGEGVYHFLSTAYSDLVSEKVTAKLLENMDEIESGKKDYRKVLKQILAEISNIQ